MKLKTLSILTFLSSLSFQLHAHADFQAIEIQVAPSDFVFEEQDPSSYQAIGSAILNRKTGEKIDAVYLNSDKPDFAGRTFLRYRYTTEKGNVSFIGPTYITTQVSKTEQEIKRTILAENREIREHKKKYYWITKNTWGKLSQHGHEDGIWITNILYAGITTIVATTGGGPTTLFALVVPALPLIVDTLVLAPIVFVQRTIDETAIKLSNRRISKALDVIYDQDSKNFKINDRKFNFILDRLQDFIIILDALHNTNS